MPFPSNVLVGTDRDTLRHEEVRNEVIGRMHKRVTAETVLERVDDDGVFLDDEAVLQLHFLSRTSVDGQIRIGFRDNEQTIDTIATMLVLQRIVVHTHFVNRVFSTPVNDIHTRVDLDRLVNQLGRIGCITRLDDTVATAFGGDGIEERCRFVDILAHTVADDGDVVAEERLIHDRFGTVHELDPHMYRTVATVRTLDVGVIVAVLVNSFTVEVIYFLRRADVDRIVVLDVVVLDERQLVDTIPAVSGCMAVKIGTRCRSLYFMPNRVGVILTHMERVVLVKIVTPLDIDAHQGIATYIRVIEDRIVEDTGLGVVLTQNMDTRTLHDLRRDSA